MASGNLSNRAIWQDVSGASAADAEKSFYGVFSVAFENTSFRIRAKPKEFDKVYTNVVLQPSVLQEIYNPEIDISKHGFTPDYAIDNIDSKKTLYIEVKR